MLRKIKLSTSVKWNRLKMLCVQDKSCQRALSSYRLWRCNSKIWMEPCWLVIYHSDWPNWWHIVKSLGFSPALPGDTPPFSTHALNKRSGIDRGLGVLINLTSIYKAIGWITRDASLHKLTNRPPTRRKSTLRGRCRAGQGGGWAQRRQTCSSTAI